MDGGFRGSGIGSLVGFANARQTCRVRLGSAIQADAIGTEAMATLPLADEYEASQQRGEVTSKRMQPRGSRTAPPRCSRFTTKLSEPIDAGDIQPPFRPISIAGKRTVQTP